MNVFISQGKEDCQKIGGMVLIDKLTAKLPVCNNCFNTYRST